MAMNNSVGLKPVEGYSPLTKSLSVEEALMLIQLSCELPKVANWQEEALYRLPQASRVRRQEIIRAILNGFLETSEGQFIKTPLVELLSSPQLPEKLKRDLLFFQYSRITPLIWESIQSVLLPRAESYEKNPDNKEIREISVSDWLSFLKPRLNTDNPGTIDKTRRIINAQLSKFGLLEAIPIQGDRLGKQYYAHFYQPDVRAFWFSLTQEFTEHNWTSRSEQFICQYSWTRTAYCTTSAYARFALDEAEKHGLVIIDFFGTEKQFTLRGPDPWTRLLEAIRYA